MKLNFTWVDYAIFGWLTLFIIATFLFYNKWSLLVYIIGWTILMLIKTKGGKNIKKIKFNKQNLKNFLWRVGGSITLGVVLWLVLTLLGVFR